MKKRVFSLTMAVALTALASAGPVFAQDGTRPGGDATGVQENRDNDGFDLGWLGLLGLAGLAGLRKPAPTVVHRDTVTRP